MGRCYCHKCKQWYFPGGITRHRAMHRDKGENVDITFSNKRTIHYEFKKRKVTA